MKRRAIIFTTLILFGATVSLIFSSQVFARLITIYPPEGQPLETRLILEAEMQQPLEQEAMTETRQVVEHRLTKLNLAGSYRVIERGEQLIIILPALENPHYIASIVSHQGEIEFINGGVGTPPLAQKIETAAIADLDVNTYQTLFTGEAVSEAITPDTANGDIFYRLRLDADAVQRFDTFTEDEVGYYLCMAVDKEVINCSAMYHINGDTLEILPNLSSGTTIGISDMAIFLESGPLPVPMDVVIE